MASRAEKDFQKAIQLRPDYGEAHIGLAYSYLQLRRAKPALREAEAAGKILGDSRPLHLAKAEAYRQQVMLAKAVTEYQSALKYQADDMPTYLAMADAQYRLHEYEASVETLNTAVKQSGQDPIAYAQMARGYARLRRDQDAMTAIQSAERAGGNNSKVLLATAEALLVMGNNDQAMARYGQALELSEADRLETRLALARLFSQEGKYYLQNVRMMKGDRLLLVATPSLATIQVTNALNATVTVRQLSAEDCSAVEAGHAAASVPYSGVPSRGAGAFPGSPQSP